MTSVVSIDPDIRDGEPCFTGTRIPVSTIYHMVEVGSNPAEIAASYPHLTDAHWAFIDDWTGHKSRDVEEGHHVVEMKVAGFGHIRSRSDVAGAFEDLWQWAKAQGWDYHPQSAYLYENEWQGLWTHDEGDKCVWRFVFHDAEKAMLFKLTWAGRL